MKKVTVYTSNTCGFCHQVKDYLNDKNITFDEKNISTNSEYRNDLIKLGFRGVPIIIVDDETIQGFDKEKLDKVLS